MFAELFDFLPASFWQYVYLPYMITVWLAVEWLRYQFDGIDTRIKPKHLALLVGILAGCVIHFGEKFLEGVTISPATLMVSFLFTTWIYEYGVKALKTFLANKFPFFKSIFEKQNQ